MSDTIDDRKEIYKFLFAGLTEIIGLIILACLIWIPCPKENQSMANIAIGFVTASVIGTPLAFVLGGNPTTKKGGDVSVPGNQPTVTNVTPTAQVNEMEKG